jgi:hypothetical protein
VNERDIDRDGFIACDECDDGDAATYPGAPQVCDGVNSDCDDPQWPSVPDAERDTDGDGWPACSECDDDDELTYFNAPQECDGVNHNCADQGWPDLPDVARDRDGDGFTACTGDCNDSDPRAFPSGVDSCNGLDDDCDGWTDETSACLRCAPVEMGPLAVLDSIVGGTWGAVDLVRTRDGYAVAWMDSGKLVGLFDVAGTPLLAPRALPETTTSARLLSSGSQFGIAFVDATGKLGFRQIGTDLAEIAVDTNIAQPSPPVAGWNGLEFVVPGFAGNHFHVSRILPSGFLVGRIRNDFAYVPADLAWNGQRRCWVPTCRSCSSRS